MMQNSSKNTDAERKKQLDQAAQNMKTELRSGDRGRIDEAYRNLRSIFLGDDVLRANEVQANYMSSVTLVLVIFTLMLTFLLTYLQIFDFKMITLSGCFGSCILLSTVGVALCFTFKGENPWLKYFLIGVVCFTMANVYAVVGPNASIIMALPVVLSVRYLSHRFTAIIAGLTAILFIGSTMVYAYMGASPDLDCVPFDSFDVLNIGYDIDQAVANLNYSVKDYLHNLMIWTYLPNLMQYVVISVICILVAKYCHQTVLNQAEITSKAARMDTELELARSIQLSAVPNSFPAIPEKPEFELYASMTPAREIGGDFYDFFMLDENTLGIVIADVSGKGVPAALFMMRSKTMIKNVANASMSPAAVFTKANQLLCEDNPEGMFVTAWYGRLDLRTGVITAVNAGHEYPAVMRAGGEYELFKDRHGLVLAGMDGVRYREYELKLEPGDRLFIYTDGVTEASNQKEELLGNDRMLALLNANRTLDEQGLLEGVLSGLQTYADGAPQFDDITMLGLTYLGPQAQQD